MERTVYSKEEIAQRLETLPRDVRALIYSADMDAALQQITNKYSLHIDQMGALETETVDTMIATETPETFVERIADSLEIDEARARAIASDINQLLFLKIRESMQKVAQVTPARESTPAAVVQPPVMISVKPITSSLTTTAPAVEATTRPTEIPLQRSTPPTEKSESPMITTPPKQEVQAMPMAEAMLTQKTISTPAGTTPAAYKTDPYREPPE